MAKTYKLAINPEMASYVVGCKKIESLDGDIFEGNKFLGAKVFKMKSEDKTLDNLMINKRVYDLLTISDNVSVTQLHVAVIKRIILVKDKFIIYVLAEGASRTVSDIES